MKKAMVQIDFELSDDGIMSFSQESAFNENGCDCICFSVEQGKIIMKWIQDAITAYESKNGGK